MPADPTHDPPKIDEATNQAFGEQVLACVEEINAILPKLAVRHRDFVILTALAEHLGEALQYAIRNNTTSPYMIRYLLDHMRYLAFRQPADTEASP